MSLEIIEKWTLNEGSICFECDHMNRAKCAKKWRYDQAITYNDGSVLVEECDWFANIITDEYRTVDRDIAETIGYKDSKACSNCDHYAIAIDQDLERELCKKHKLFLDGEYVDELSTNVQCCDHHDWEKR